MRASLTPNNDRSSDSPRKKSRSIRTWGVIAAIVVVLGSVSSIIGANAVDNAQSQRIHRAFLTSSVEIGSTLKLEIQGQRDLIGSVESFLVGDPRATQAQFTRWSKDVRVLQRYGAVTSLGVLEYVTAAELPAYAKRVSAQQATPFRIEPPGKRPYYCLAPVGITRPGSPVLTRDLDVCGSGLGPIFMAARDGGKSAVLPYTSDG